MEENDYNTSNNSFILVELIKNQLKNITSDKKLLYNDLKRISKYLNKSIFESDCSLWSGYVTVIKNDDKNSYINFYFNSKKYALHRLLFINYIGDLSDSEYIKFKCSNKGKCCNIHHFYKIAKNDNLEEPIKKIESDNNSTQQTQQNKESKKNIIVGFGL